MIAASIHDFEPHGGNFLVVHINSGSLGPGDCKDTIVSEQFDDRQLEARDQRPNAKVPSAKIDQGIDHKLSWAVPGYLSSPVTAIDREAMRRMDVLRVTIHAQGQQGGVSQEPDLIGCFRVSAPSEALHGFKAGEVGLLAESKQRGRVLTHESRKSLASPRKIKNPMPSVMAVKRTLVPMAGSRPIR